MKYLEQGNTQRISKNWRNKAKKIKRRARKCTLSKC